MAREDGPRGGGALIALLVLAGALIGTFIRQPSIGILVGAALGIVAALVFWLRDRGRG